MRDDDTLILGAVAYDPKVVTIWDGFRAYFAEHGLDFDYVLFSNYERQVQAHFDGLITVAWNSPLAWLQSESIAAASGRKVQALCMRDTDRDLTSLIVVRSDGTLRTPADLKGRRVAVGAADSPQATLIPLGFLAAQGLQPGVDFELARFDLLAGKHGDHIGGEREAVRALIHDQADAACILDANQLLFEREATVAPGALRVVARTPAYDHCNFTVIAPDAATAPVKRFAELLMAMSHADERVRPLLDMEGLKQWTPGRASGYAQLRAAVDRFGTIDRFVRQYSVARQK
ncbi:MAG TPA: PhnD/SsuA/transferrin family substrate-binding protein [Candidatus Binataceae bacterium]|nr:PhnD/SsuA/transferrin family substrate-binding protein [Candidatus Binataceae bacterium]